MLGVPMGLLLNSVRWSTCSCDDQDLRSYFTNCTRRRPGALPTDAGSIPAISTISQAPLALVDTGQAGLFVCREASCARFLPAYGESSPAVAVPPARAAGTAAQAFFCSDSGRGRRSAPGQLRPPFPTTNDHADVKRGKFHGNCQVVVLGSDPPRHRTRVRAPR